MTALGAATLSSCCYSDKDKSEVVVASSTLDKLQEAIKADSVSALAALFQTNTLADLDWTVRNADIALSTVLELAAQNKAKICLEYLLTEQNADPNAACCYSALNTATEQGCKEMVSALKKAGANDQPSYLGWTNLEVAAWSNVPEIISGALRQGNINAQDFEGAGVMYQGLWTNAEGLKLLLAAKPDLTQTDSLGFNILNWAVFNDIVLASYLLTEAGAKLQELDKSFDFNFENELQYLLSLADRAMHPTDADTALYKQLADILDQDKADLLADLIKEHSLSNLDDLVTCQDVSVTWICLRDVLGLAISKDAILCTTWLLDHDPRCQKTGFFEQFSAGGCTPLIRAATRDRAEFVRLLLKRGAKPNTQNIVGETALLTSAQRSGVETIQVLLDAGCSQQIACKMGKTPLFWAVREGKPDVVKLLLSQKAPNAAPVNQATYSGLTPLYLAAAKGSIQMTRALLSAGADVQGANGFDPLCAAVKYAAPIAVIEDLLKAGASPLTIDREGKNALEYAQGQPAAIIDLLNRYKELK